LGVEKGQGRECLRVQGGKNKNFAPVAKQGGRGAGLEGGSKCLRTGDKPQDQFARRKVKKVEDQLRVVSTVWVNLKKKKGTGIKREGREKNKKGFKINRYIFERRQRDYLSRVTSTPCSGKGFLNLDREKKKLKPPLG